MVMGILFIYSSAINSNGELVSTEYISQIIWAVLGLVIFFALLAVDYTIIRRWSLSIYLVLAVLLILTLFVGRKVNGARSWLGFLGLGIQPSEFMKIGAILLFADFFDKNAKHVDELPVFLRGMALALIPTVLILAQPDLGTASVFLPIYLLMSFAAGTRVRYIIFIIATGMLTLVFGVLPVWQVYFAHHEVVLSSILVDPFLFQVLIFSCLFLCLLSWLGFFLMKKGYFYWLAFFLSILTIAFAASTMVGKVLHDYQIMRLIVFIDPSIDPQGSGWNIIQSVTAVGSGGFWGKGYLAGTQSHYRFLPQQSTDFIFSIISEELGFAGSLMVIILFCLIILRGLSMIHSSKDRFGAFVITGVASMLFFHMVVNIGMAIGIMPITGIPLFFLSYGGSSLWTALVGVSLIQNIYIRRYRY